MIEPARSIPAPWLHVKTRATCSGTTLSGLLVQHYEVTRLARAWHVLACRDAECCCIAGSLWQPSPLGMHSGISHDSAKATLAGPTPCSCTLSNHCVTLSPPCLRSPAARGGGQAGEGQAAGQHRVHAVVQGLLGPAGDHPSHWVRVRPLRMTPSRHNATTRCFMFKIES